MADRPQHGFSTRAIHAGQGADPATGATVVPIYATSTFTQAEPGRHKGYEYSRSGNPTRAALETCLAALEGGERALAFASGLAATTGVLATLRPGDEVAVAADLYGGTFRLLDKVFKPWGLVPRYTEDASPEGFATVLTARPPSSSGSRRRPIRCCKSSTSPPSPNWPTARAPCWRSTTRSRPPISSARSSTGPIWSSTARPSISAATPT